MSLDDDGKKQELRKKIEYQVACEERAFRIVERLIENPITKQFLLDALQFITPNHYNDIIEERAISKLCGYPVCGKQLTNIPKQKYTISTKTNKVYDIESRKNFCSGMCYKASLYLEKQISTAPVWSRQKQPPVRFELLPLDGKSGCLGEEVILNPREKVKEEVIKVEKLDKYQEALKKKQLQERDSSLTIDSGGSLPGKVTKSDSTAEDKSGDFEKRVSIDNEKNYQNVAGDQDDKAGEKGPNFFHTGSNIDDKNDAQVYTLDRALDEMKIGSYDIGIDMCESKLAQSEGVENRNENLKNVDLIHKKKQEGTSTTQNKKMLNSESVTLDKHLYSVDVRSESNNIAMKVSKEKGTNESELSNKCKIGPDPGESKTDYLMKLLDKRKSLLAKMADIQPLSATNQKSSKEGAVSDKTDNAKSCEQHSPSVILAEIQDKVRVKPYSAEKSDQSSTISNRTGKDFISEIDDNSKSGKDSHVKSEYNTEEKQNLPVTSDTTLLNQNKTNSESKRRAISTLELICKSVQAWMTVESLEYLKTEESAESVQVKSEFERQYKALEAKIDKQERDFDDMLGKEDMNKEDSIDRPSAPLPHFQVLREEIEDDTVRVREFLKGSFTYKVEERENKKDNSQEIVLPSVDRYDQMLIRQRIVLDRISKVLPDLLTPLHLLIQHVFTDLRELVCTFNLTKDNILFKPAEWILVTLVLLKLISGRNALVGTGFDTTEANKYFGIVLRGVSSSLEELDRFVLQLKSSRNNKVS